jgi:glycosyltransferase involved in cell wall biosynthesis
VGDNPHAMRILFVSHYALPHLGGIEVVIDALARRMTARGHEVTHVAGGTGEDLRDFRAPPYRVVRVPAINVVERRLGIPVPILGPALWRVLGDEIAAADVVHAHGVLYQACNVALRMARRRGHRGRVVTEHVGSVPYDSRAVAAVQRAAMATVGRATARAAQAIVTLNERVGAEMATLAPEVRRVEIANGVDFERFHAAPKELRARPRILFAGRMVEKKGLPLVLDAARRLGDAVDVVLAGPGNPGALPPNVRHAGAMPQDELARLYAECDLFLLPSRGEGFPLTAQEAMASGLPVILGNDPAYRTMLDGSGDAATLVPLDVDAVVAAVRALLGRDLRELGAQAAHFARERFGWDAAVDRHLALYDDIVNGATDRGR